MKKIELTQGQFAKVSDNQYERVNQYLWCAQKLGTKNRNSYYAVRGITIDGKQRLQTLHEFIKGKRKGKVIDHKNGDGENCCNHNMRFCTQAQNLINRSSKINGTSKYKGVSFCKNMHTWIAQIRFENKITFLGYFDTEIEASNAYQLKAIEIFGKFRRLN